MAGNLIVSDRLKRNVNYELWSIQVKTYLVGQDLWDVVQLDEHSREVEISPWRQKNASALHAIQVSCESDALSVIKDITSAKIAWNNLALVFRVKRQIKEDSGKRLYLVT